MIKLYVIMHVPVHRHIYISYIHIYVVKHILYIYCKYIYFYKTYTYVAFAHIIPKHMCVHILSTLILHCTRDANLHSSAMEGFVWCSYLTIAVRGS